MCGGPDCYGGMEREESWEEEIEVCGGGAEGSWRQGEWRSQSMVEAISGGRWDVEREEIICFQWVRQWKMGTKERSWVVFGQR